MFNPILTHYKPLDKRMVDLSYLFKFVMAGDVAVGKSSILLQFIDSRFKPEYEMTIGVEFGSISLTVEGRAIKLQIWDTAGQESFRSITRSYYRVACGFVLIYDVTRRETFEHIRNHFQEIKAISCSSFACVLVGNKCDAQRVVSSEEGQALANELGVMFMEVSAQRREQVSIVFDLLARAVLQKIEKSELDPNEDTSGVRIRTSS